MFGVAAKREVTHYRAVFGNEVNALNGKHGFDLAQKSWFFNYVCSLMTSAVDLGQVQVLKGDYIADTLRDSPLKEALCISTL